MYEAVENIDYRRPTGAPVDVRVIEICETIDAAVEAARVARKEFLEADRKDYAW